jgi:hypothetical protein
MKFFVYIQRLFIIAASLCLASQALAQIGTNAPPIPATYNTGHPRLPSPDAGFLNSLASNPAALAVYNGNADAWDSTNPGNTWQLRELVIAYMANKIANPAKAATYLSKIKALTNLGGFWAPLLYSVNDGVGNGTYTLTSATANFLTGCSGGSCVGNFLAIEAVAYNILSVPNANTVVLSANNPPPSGTNLPVRVFVPNVGTSDINIAIIYDWLYNDLDAATRAEFLNELNLFCTGWEANYLGVGASPYNDVFYIRLGISGLIDSLVLYPDHPSGLQHLQFSTDVWFNVLMPVWRQVFGPEGGGWHEGWPDYVDAASGNGLDTFIVPSLLSWQSASGDPIFTREPWLKNFAYFTMYMTRPDYIMESIGDSSRPYLLSETNSLGSLNGLAEIYNDPVLRGWARSLNGGNVTAPLGFEPSAWPFYRPDNSSNAVADRSALPPVRNFTGWGMLSMRTGWTENDTSLTLKYGDNFWSHEHFDNGAFTLFSRGLLALDSGSYRAGSNSEHENQYGRQTIAHNTLTVTDPSDYYPSQTFASFDNQGNEINQAPPNDGGQRRVGSLYNSLFPQLASPNTIGDWLRNWDYYHMGTLVGLATTPNYTYAATDITAAYNNKFSASTPNATNRTNRVQKAVRHMLMIPRGTSAYVVVFDQVTSTNASFVKRWLLHTVNQPVVTGNSYTVTRNELVNPLPYIGAWPAPYGLKYTTGAGANTQYQYDGKLYGWMVQPQAGNINIVGGPGKEFWVADPANPGGGTNWNMCMQGQCDANVEGLGPVQDFINPVSATAPHEPGSWRIEISPSTPATQDYFLNVLLATTTEDTHIPSSVTAPAGLAANMAGATWVENGNTYTVTFPLSGVGGHITIGSTVNEDLLSHATQLPATLTLVSGGAQSGVAGGAAPNPLVVKVTDSAGNPVPNAVVHFGITQGNGSVPSELISTNAQGIASTTLNLGSGAIGTTTIAMADVNGLQPVSFNVTLAGSLTLGVSSLNCTPTTVNALGTVTCTIGLTQAAPATGATVTISSSSSALTVPATVSVGNGASTVTFTATAGSITSPQAVILTASLGSVAQTATISVTAPLALGSFSCSPSALSSQGITTCTVVLSQAAPSSGSVVTLTSNSSQLTVPPSVTVPSNSSSVSFSATAGTITSSLTAVVTASFGGGSQTFSLSLSPSTGNTNSSGGTPIPLGNWTMIQTHGFPEQTVGFEKLVYAPSPVRKAAFLGNYHELSTEPNAAIVAYDFDTNRWDILDIGENFHTENFPDAGHSVGGFAYDPNINSFIYHCCASGSEQPENTYGTWWFDFFGQTGRIKQTSPKPGTIMEESSAFDALHNTFVVVGGNSNSGTWTYNPTTDTYTQQTPAGTPPNPSVTFPAMTYNTNDHRVYLFGGQAGTGYSNDLYAYDVPTNTWTHFTPSGALPAPRFSAGLAYDSTNNVFMLYGGTDNSKVYNDTWIYNPAANAWTQLNPPQAPPFDTAAPFENLAYDSDHNAFILVLRGGGGYADGGGYNNSAQTWFFRYQGSGPNVGTSSANYTPSAGSMNLHSDDWAAAPSLSAAGGTLYSAWVETGEPFDTSNATWFHAFASARNSAGSWTWLGGAPASIDSEFSNYSESHSPSITIVNGTPWLSWYKWNNSVSLWSIWAKSWNGTGWQGGQIGTTGTSPGFEFQGRSQMVGIGSAPYIAYLEVDKSFFPQKTFAYAKTWNGTNWTQVGSAPLNVNVSANTTASSVSIASDGTNPYVAWTEYTSDNMLQKLTYPQVYVAHWNGSAWSMVGNPLNVSATGWADDASIAYLNGQPYVAWTERNTAAGNAQLFVKTFNGSSWVLVGSGTLNKDTNTGWAFRPSLVADAPSGSLYVAWTEQQAIGQPAQAYAAKYAGGAWSSLGGPLNVSTTSGSAQRISLSVVSGAPAVAWGEVSYGSLRQVFIKQWNGANWGLISGSSTGSTVGTGNSGTPASACDLNSDGKVDSSDVQIAVNQALGTATCSSSDLMHTGQCNVVDVQRVIVASLGGACITGQ